MITKTWREQNDVANWMWQLSAGNDISGEWVWGELETIRSLCAGFARVSSIDIDTLSGMDEGRYAVPDQLAAVHDVIQRCRDLYGVTLVLDLECASPDGEPLVISHGATLTISLPRTPEGDIERGRHPLLYFHLNTDIYDPDSPEGDNEEMAAMNSPRLTGFLHRVETIGAEFVEVDGPCCPGVHRYGFAMNDA